MGRRRESHPGRPIISANTTTTRAPLLSSRTTKETFLVHVKKESRSFLRWMDIDNQKLEALCSVLRVT